MSYGSFNQMWNYVNKIFNIKEKFDDFSDPRRDPDLPLTPGLLTWFWGMVRRLNSTEQVGDLLVDPRWRKRVDLKVEHGGSPDTVARILNGLSIEEWNEFLLEAFFIARRAGILKDDGPYGLRCAIIDLNELFKSEKRHCEHCQVREKNVKDRHGQERVVKEYYHQAVALVWASGDIAWPLGFELLAPGEGELTAGKRLLKRLLPRLSKSLDLVMGDSLYCCRPFFKIVCGNGIDALAISSENTEMDEEIELLMSTEPSHTPQGLEVEMWEMESEAWFQALKRELRVVHYRRLYESKPWKNERKELRIVTSSSVGVLPTRQGWKVGRCRWMIENATFNILTRDYSLTHNYRHSIAAIMALLVLRSLSYCITYVYRRFALARSENPPKGLRRWYDLVIREDWVRFLDGYKMISILDTS